MVTTKRREVRSSSLWSAYYLIENCRELPMDNLVHLEVHDLSRVKDLQVDLGLPGMNSMMWLQFTVYPVNPF